jgi:ubiquinone/menaquinone biosynthesis C-methylase UbiE
MGWGTSLLKGCKTLIGVDIDHGAISEARRRYSYRAEFIVADLGKLGFADSTFDIVACLEGIEHVPPDVGQAFLAESYRVLRRQGVLFLSSPHCCTMEHSGNPHHFKEYTYHEIRSLVDPYFQIAQVAERSVGNLRVFYLQAIKTK